MSRKSNVSNGDFCQKTLPSKRKPHPETAWKKIGADLWVHQGKQFLLVIDYYSRFPEIAFTSGTTNDAVINKLKDMFAKWGIPHEIVSDNGPPFASDQLYKFSHEYDFKHTFTSPYCQQANGEAESVVRIAKILKQSDPFFHLCPTELHPTHPQV